MNLDTISAVFKKLIYNSKVHKIRRELYSEFYTKNIRIKKSAGVYKIHRIANRCVPRIDHLGLKYAIVPAMRSRY